MSEFKITHETTLYQVQEECKENDDCEECVFYAVISDCDTLAACRALIYDGAIYCTNRELNCDKCWNEIMEDDINAE